MDKAESKYSLPLGTLRYRVEFCDEAKAIQLATKEGWKEGESLYDYIDPIANDAYVWKAFKTKEAAIEYAKSVSARDIFRSPSIDELELRLRVIERTRFKEWEQIDRWLLDDGELVDAA